MPAKSGGQHPKISRQVHKHYCPFGTDSDPCYNSNRKEYHVRQDQS